VRGKPLVRLRRSGRSLLLKAWPTSRSPPAAIAPRRSACERLRTSPSPGSLQAPSRLRQYCSLPRRAPTEGRNDLGSFPPPGGFSSLRERRAVGARPKQRRDRPWSRLTRAQRERVPRLGLRASQAGIVAMVATLGAGRGRCTFVVSGGFLAHREELVGSALRSVCLAGGPCKIPSSFEVALIGQNGRRRGSDHGGGGVSLQRDA
jgi:hypothetical protein